MKLKVKKNDKVKWVWVVDNTRHPQRGAHARRTRRASRRATSRSGDDAIGVSFKRKFKKPGTYDFICTYHRAVMKMTVKVKQ